MERYRSGEHARLRVWWSAPPATTSWHLLYFLWDERKQSARARVLPGNENACVTRRSGWGSSQILLHRRNGNDGSLAGRTTPIAPFSHDLARFRRAEGVPEGFAGTLNHGIVLKKSAVARENFFFERLLGGVGRLRPLQQRLLIGTIFLQVGNLELMDVVAQALEADDHGPHPRVVISVRRNQVAWRGIELLCALIVEPDPGPGFAVAAKMHHLDHGEDERQNGQNDDASVDKESFDLLPHLIKAAATDDR